MRDFSNRAKLTLAGATMGLLAAGAAGAVAIPAAAQGAARAPAAVHVASAPAYIVQVCLTVREIHFGPACIRV